MSATTPRSDDHRGNGGRKAAESGAVPRISLESGFVLPVAKRTGCTSHDVVVLLRSLFGIQKIGHAGTLDPFATGLLICCVGRATKLSNYLMDLDKTYEGDLRLGFRTNTGDRTGTTVAEAPVPEADPVRFEKLAETFVGEFLQTPPMVSALKHKGQRLYELARKGVEVERTPRRIHVHEFRILGVSSPLVHFRVRCGRGTYVRTLVEDFCRGLGTEGTVDTLSRTEVGPFHVESAVDQERISAGDLEAALARAVPMGEALAQHRRVTLTDLWVRRVRQGNSPPWSSLDVEGADPPAPGDVVRMHGPEGTLVAIARVRAVPGAGGRDWIDARELVLERVL